MADRQQDNRWGKAYSGKADFSSGNDMNVNGSQTPGELQRPLSDFVRQYFSNLRGDAAKPEEAGSGESGSVGEALACRSFFV